VAFLVVPIGEIEDYAKVTVGWSKPEPAGGRERDRDDSPSQRSPSREGWFGPGPC